MIMQPVYYRKFLLTPIIILISFCVAGQNVGINTDGSLPDANAMLDIKSGNKGILIPRMNSTTRQSIPNTPGLMVYDITTQSFWYNNGTEWANMVATPGWSLTGNSGISASQFIGTTDNVPLQIKVNNRPSGLIDPSLAGNTFWGAGSGWDLTTGTMNTGTGYFSLRSITTGSKNTANGYQALHNNTTGYNNTATGYNAMLANTSGFYNVATGDESMQSNTIGARNTANGSGAMYDLSEGNSNTAVGTEALVNSFTGSFNTAVGDWALHNLVSGSNNTAVGYNTSVSVGNLSNATVIGAGAVVNSSNKVRIGNASVTVIEGQVPFTTPSDGRFKYNIQENVGGLDFILKLRPVTYQFDVKRFDDQLRTPSETGKQLQVSGRSIEPGINISQAVSQIDETMQKSYAEAAQIRRTGFIAQEVEKAAIASGYNFSGIIKPKTDKEHYSLSYESFVVPLVKAVQEQQQIIESQNQKIAVLQEQVQNLLQLFQPTRTNKQ
jgi:hypothetical protein